MNQPNKNNQPPEEIPEENNPYLISRKMSMFSPYDESENTPKKPNPKEAEKKTKAMAKLKKLFGF